LDIFLKRDTMHDNSAQPNDFHDQLRQLESRHIRLCSWLRSELGYDSESEGNVNRRLQETHDIAAETLKLLRGEGTEMGIIGRVAVLTKSWNVLLCSVTALAGYIIRLFTE